MFGRHAGLGFDSNLGVVSGLGVDPEIGFGRSFGLCGDLVACFWSPPTSPAESVWDTFVLRNSPKAEAGGIGF